MLTTNQNLAYEKKDEIIKYQKDQSLKNDSETAVISNSDVKEIYSGLLLSRGIKRDFESLPIKRYALLL